MPFRADEGDTETIQETVAEAGERITTVVADANEDEVAKQVSAETDIRRNLVRRLEHTSRASPGAVNNI